MPNLLTQREAWLVIAEDFYKARREIGEYGFCPNFMQARFGPNIRGICWAIADLHHDSIISKATRLIMMDVTSEGMPDSPFDHQGHWFCNPYLKANDLLRADFCYMQYCMLGGE